MNLCQHASCASARVCAAQWWLTCTLGVHVMQVIAIVKRFLVEHGLTNKPLFLWGASSGGTLALKLPAALKAKREAAVDGEYVFKVDGIISGQACSAIKRYLAAISPLYLTPLLCLLLSVLSIRFTCTVHLSSLAFPLLAEVATPTNYASDRSGGLAVPDFPPTVFIGMQVGSRRRWRHSA